MATYGGGLTFTIGQNFGQQTGNVSNQVYVVPGPATGYTMFKPLSITQIGGPLIQGQVSLVVQNDNGVGGWVTAYEFFGINTGLSSVNYSAGLATYPLVGANPDGFIVLAPGQRVVFGTNLITGTIRFTFMYFEYQAS